MSTTGDRAAAQGGARVSYDHASALAYLRLYWDVVASDGFIAGQFGGTGFVRAPSGTQFVHDFTNDTETAVAPGGTVVATWAQEDDCTHFISCCIGQPPGGTGGGIPITVNELGLWPNAPYGIVNVHTMVDYLTKRHFVDVIGKQSTDASLIQQLVPGDLIAYWSIALAAYSHLAMYLGGGIIGSHSLSRSDNPACTWDNQWPLAPGHTWTFLHFTV